MQPFEQFECENLFKNALKTGINLFCGAGFSILAQDKENKYLPTGNALLDELSTEFSIISQYSNLPRACTKIENTDKLSFYQFLKERFTVSNYDKRYEKLLNINICNIYTTNIDDLFFKLFENSNNIRYLNDKSSRGNSYDTLAINYFPLHGCVRHNNDKYVFGATEIASAFSQRGSEKSWDSLAKDASDKPILFWGWNFEDSGPIEAMYGNGNTTENNVNRWVLLYKPNYETIDYLKSLNFNIIIGETSQMLDYIANCNSFKESEEKQQISNNTADLLKRYLPPANDKSLPSYPRESFFIDYTPHWSNIFSGVIPKTSNYKEIADNILAGKNIICIGIRGSGKTTLMMQLLAELNTSLPKHYMVSPSKEQVVSYLTILQDYKSILFIDDCFRDTNALLELFKAENVQIVCFDRDFNYECQFHHLKKHDFELVDVTEITKLDAQSIIDIIPNTLKKKYSGTKYFEKDPTIPNLLAKCLKATNFNFMKRFYDKDRDAAKVFLMICYVHACGVPCSFDMIYSFLGDDEYSWQEMFSAVKRAGGLIKDCSDYFCTYDLIDSIQDYYQCRSRFFAEKIIFSIPKGNKIFASILNDFALYVPNYKICLYDKFKRRGYDADFAVRAFPKVEDGEYYYNICAQKDDSEYIYQQAAIYFSRLTEYKKAFEWIDKARNLAHYNRFSIDSTYAKIYFDVNLEVNQEQALEALNILSNCCTNDKRKAIHFSTFAKCVLQFHIKYNNADSFEMINKALIYVREGLADSNHALSRKNKYELKDLEKSLKNFSSSN